MTGGCNGRVCRACRPVMQKMRLERYPLDEFGERDFSATPENGWVCGFICGSGSRGADELELAGNIPSEGGRQKLVVAAGSHLPLEAGDIVFDRGGRRLTVTEVFKNGSARVAEAC